MRDLDGKKSPSVPGSSYLMIFIQWHYRSSEGFLFAIDQKLRRAVLVPMPVDVFRIFRPQGGPSFSPITRPPGSQVGAES